MPFNSLSPWCYDGRLSNCPSILVPMSTPNLAFLLAFLSTAPFSMSSNVGVSWEELGALFATVARKIINLENDGDAIFVFLEDVNC